MSLIRFKNLIGIVLLMGILLAESGIASCCIESKEELVRIDRTKGMLVEKAWVTFESPADLSKVMTPCICSLVDFSLSEDGRPIGAKVVRSVPERILDRSALLALMKSDFRKPEGDETKDHLMLFIYCFQ